MTARDIMNKNVITVKAEDKIDDLVNLLLDKKISGVPVVDNENRVVGIVSETDLIYPEKKVHLPAFIPVLDSVIFIESFRETEKEIRKMAAYKVEDVMVRKVIKVKEDTEIEEITNIFIDKRVNRVPVVDENNKLVGIITRTDILKHIY